MDDRQDVTPTNWAAGGGVTGQTTGEPSTPDYITPTPEVPTAEQWKRLDAYNETALLRGLMHCSYGKVLEECANEDPGALFSPPRRLILETLLRVATRAVESDAGERPVNPYAVIAELNKTPGAEARTALTVELPNVLSGPVEGMHATIPNVFDIPALWEVVNEAHMYRACGPVGRALIGVEETRDPFRMREALRQLVRLLVLAEAAGFDAQGDDRRTA